MNSDNQQEGQRATMYEPGERRMDDERFKQLEIMLKSAVKHLDAFRSYASDSDEGWGYHDELYELERDIDRARDLLVYVSDDHAYEKQFARKGSAS